ERTAATPVVGEVRDGAITSFTGADLLAMIRQARAAIRARGLKPGDRCALYGANSVRWIAADLALMSEGVVVVPLDPRQAAGEISVVLRDATPSLVLCSDAAFAANLPPAAQGSPATVLFDEIFSGQPGSVAPPVARGEDDAVTIVYTSGTSGEQKGAIV